MEGSLLGQAFGRLLTLPMVQHQDKLDEHFVADTLRMFLKAAGTETLPPECKDKDVLDRALYLRYEKVSPHETIGTWSARCIPQDGSKVDWTTAGAYNLQFDSSSGLLRSLQHRASGHVASVPDDISIDKSFNYTSPASDKSALLSKGRLLKYFCIDFFDTKLLHGPHSYHVDKRQNEMKTIVQLAVDHVAESRAPSAPAAAEVVLTDHAPRRSPRKGPRSIERAAQQARSHFRIAGRHRRAAGCMSVMRKAHRDALACGRNRHECPFFPLRRGPFIAMLVLPCARAHLGDAVVSMRAGDHSRPTLSAPSQARLRKHNKAFGAECRSSRCRGPRQTFAAPGQGALLALALRTIDSDFPLLSGAPSSCQRPT